MKTHNEYLKELKCNVDSTDKIPIIDFCNNSSNFYGPLALICENNHITSYFKDPGSSKFMLSDTAQWYSIIMNKYSEFLHYSNQIVLELFYNLVNMRQLGFMNGASFALRSFIELLIYDNYGTYAWFGDSILSSKGNKEEVDEVHNNIKRLGFSTFMMIIISSSLKKQLIRRDETYLKKTHNLEGDRLDIARKAVKNLDKITNEDPWISKELLKKISGIFENISPFVHSKPIIDESPDLDKGVETVLKAYEEFYKNNKNEKRWRVNYE